MPPARRAAALLAATTIAVLALGGTAAADAQGPSATPTPTPTCQTVCLPSPTLSPSASPTPSPTAKQTHPPAPSPTPSPTRVRRTSSPKPRVTAAQQPATTTEPSLDVGVPSFTDPPTASPTAVKAKPAASKGSSKLSRIGVVVIGGAILLGLGGGAGLYLTRHQA